jgi:hypothetical protein
MTENDRQAKIVESYRGYDWVDGSVQKALDLMVREGIAVILDRLSARLDATGTKVVIYDRECDDSSKWGVTFDLDAMQRKLERDRAEYIDPEYGDYTAAAYGEAPWPQVAQ